MQTVVAVGIAALLVLFALFWPIINRFILFPRRVRLHLSKYQNVYVDPKGSAFLGDASNIAYTMQVDKGTFLQRQVRAVQANPQLDIVYMSLLPFTFVVMASTEANEQLRNLIPQKADRVMLDKVFLGPLSYDGLTFLPSNAKW